MLMGQYVGWLGHNNLGDEIVADIFFDLLEHAVRERVPAGAKVEFPRQIDSAIEHRFQGCSQNSTWRCHYVVMGGGSTVDAIFLERARNMMRRQRPVLLWGSGYQRVHRDAKLKASLDLLRNARVVGGIRGHVTEEFLIQHINKTFAVIGDSGFLSGALYPGRGLSLPEAPGLPDKLAPGQPLPHWPPPPKCLGTTAAAVAAAGGSMSAPCQRSLAVVTLRSELTNHDLSKDNKGFNDVADIEHLRVPRHPIAVMMLVIAELVNEHNFQVVLQDVDDKSHAVHERYLMLINKRILTGNPPVVLHREHKDYHEVMDLYERAAVSINCRLHSGVLAASALRPVIYMASLPKFKDFMSSIGQEQFLVDPEIPELKALHAPDLAKLVVSKVLMAAKNTAGISSWLQRMRDSTLVLYKKAVGDLLDQLSQTKPKTYRNAITNCQSVQIKRSHCIGERTVLMIECLA